MGLTIHYDIRSRTRSDQKAQRLVEQMRQLALDLPFEEVSDVITLEGEQCDFEAQRGKVDDCLLWLLIQSSQYVVCPWNPRRSRSVSPTRIIAFDVFPGPGSESANIGLCQYPGETEFEIAFGETRKAKTRLSGWRWSSFCKTQYASSPACGGIANFLRCHISLVTLLDRIAKLPTVKVELDDEGRYGRSHYSDDWREAHDEGREPVYTWHDGKYDAKALAAEVGDWNEMIAAMAGSLNDVVKAAGMELCSPIQSFQNFEHLEFKGAQQEHLQPFLQAMAQMAEQERAKHKPEVA